jgi:hypothetical protein
MLLLPLQVTLLNSFRHDAAAAAARHGKVQRSNA